MGYRALGNLGDKQVGRAQVRGGWCSGSWGATGGLEHRKDSRVFISMPSGCRIGDSLHGSGGLAGERAGAFSLSNSSHPTS